MRTAYLGLVVGLMMATSAAAEGEGASEPPSSNPSSVDESGSPDEGNETTDEPNGETSPESPEEGDSLLPDPICDLLTELELPCGGYVGVMSGVGDGPTYVTEEAIAVSVPMPVWWEWGNDPRIDQSGYVGVCVGFSPTACPGLP
jgi:hypothetical protein